MNLPGIVWCRCSAALGSRRTERKTALPKRFRRGEDGCSDEDGDPIFDVDEGDDDEHFEGERNFDKDDDDDEKFEGKWSSDEDDDDEGESGKYLSLASRLWPINSAYVSRIAP